MAILKAACGIAAWSLVLTWVGMSDAWAQCDCGIQTWTLEEQIDNADVIFTGELRSLSEDWEGCGQTGSWSYAMEVFDVYKGVVNERVAIESPAPGGKRCGIPIEREGVFLVFAQYVGRQREYRSTACMGTKAIENANEALLLLGTAENPEPFSCASASGRGWLVLVAPVLVALLRRRRALVRRH